MRLIDEMPNSGSFVAVWSNFGGIWCDAHKYVGEALFVFDRDEWKPCEVAAFYKRKGAIFMMDEDHGA